MTFAKWTSNRLCGYNWLMANGFGHLKGSAPPSTPGSAIYIKHNKPQEDLHYQRIGTSVEVAVVV